MSFTDHFPISVLLTVGIFMIFLVSSVLFSSQTLKTGMTNYTNSSSSNSSALDSNSSNLTGIERNFTMNVDSVSNTLSLAFPLLVIFPVILLLFKFVFSSPYSDSFDFSSHREGHTELAGGVDFNLITFINNITKSIHDFFYPPVNKN